MKKHLSYISQYNSPLFLACLIFPVTRLKMYLYLLCTTNMDLSTTNRENPEYQKASARSNEINLPRNEGMNFLPNLSDENQKDKSYILALKSNEYGK